MPATGDREKIFAAVVTTTSAAAVPAPPGGEPTCDYEDEQALKVAISTIATLKQRLSQKEATVARYQQLLQSAQDAANDTANHHQEELLAMQQRLHTRNDAAFTSFKQTVQENMNREQLAVPCNEQLMRLTQLEDIVAEQDSSLAALRDKLTASRQQTQDARQQLCEQQHDEGTQRVQQRHDSEFSKLHDEKSELSQKIASLEQQVAALQQELSEQRQANERAPSSTMKKLVERLRHQVALKEKQHSALSHALLELRADMVTQAQDDVKANADQTAVNNNIQRLVEKRTHEVQLKHELQNFGPEFFEEIEDLKYNYGEAVRKNVVYEQQLSQFEKQFGVVINMPKSP